MGVLQDIILAKKSQLVVGDDPKAVPPGSGLRSWALQRAARRNAPTMRSMRPDETAATESSFMPEPPKTILRSAKPAESADAVPSVVPPGSPLESEAKKRLAQAQMAEDPVGYIGRKIVKTIADVPRAAAQEGKTIPAGANRATVRVTNAVDFFLGKLAELGEKAGLGKKETLHGGLFKEVSKNQGYWADRLSKEGIQIPILKDLLEAAGAAPVDIAAITALGGGIPGMALHGAMMGGAEGKTPEAAVTGAITGGLTGGSLGAIGKVASPVAKTLLAGGFGAATTPGGLKEKATGALTWMGLGALGKERGDVRARDVMNEIMEGLFRHSEKRSGIDLPERILRDINSKLLALDPKAGRFTLDDRGENLVAPNGMEVSIKGIGTDSFDYDAFGELLGEAAEANRSQQPKPPAAAPRISEPPFIPKGVEPPPPPAESVAKATMTEPIKAAPHVMNTPTPSESPGPMARIVGGETVKVGGQTYTVYPADNIVYNGQSIGQVPKGEGARTVEELSKIEGIDPSMLGVSNVESKVMAEDLVGPEALRGNALKANEAAAIEKARIAKRGLTALDEDGAEISIDPLTDEYLPGGFVTLPSGKGLRAGASELYRKGIDKLNPIKKLAERARAALGEAGLDQHLDPYIAARLHAGVAGKAETYLFYKRFRVDQAGKVQFGGESLRDIGKGLTEAERQEFSEYLVSRHVPESEAQGKKTGRDVAQAEAFVAQRKTKYEARAKKFTEYCNSLLDVLVDAGRIKAEDAARYKAESPNYAPFQRILEELEGRPQIQAPSGKNWLSKVSNPIKRRHGSERDIIDPMESAVKLTYQVINAAERARIGRMIVDLRNASPELAKEIVRAKPSMKVVANEGGKKIWRKAQDQPAGTIEVWRDGTPEYYEVPEDLYNAMSLVDKSSEGLLQKFLGSTARMLRAGATLSPEFAMRNPFRDQWSAFVNAKYGYVPGVDFVRGLFDLLGHSQDYWRWKASGGDWSMLVQLDRASNQTVLRDVTGLSRKPLNMAKEIVKHPVRAIEKVSEAGELPTRLGVFKRARGKTSDIEAAFRSREASTDFNVGGAKTKDVRAAYAFLNARMQGAVQLGRSMKERPMATMAKAFAVGVLPSLALYAINRDDPAYWEIPEWQRRAFWCIPAGTKKALGADGREIERTRFLRVPKGDVGVIFGTTAEIVADYLDEKHGRSPSLWKVLRTAAAEISPVSTWGEVLPTGLRPVAEAITNRSFFRDRPIVAPGDEKVAPKFQSSQYTSETAKALGKLTGGSPPVIENTVAGMFGGLGRLALKAGDLAGKIEPGFGIGRKPNMPKDPADVVGLGAFKVRDPWGFGSQSAADFYDTLQKVERLSATGKKLAGEGRAKEFVAWAKGKTADSLAVARKRPSLITKGESKSLAEDMSAAGRKLSDLRKQRIAAAGSEKLSVEQKQKILDVLDSQVMSVVVPLMNEYRYLEQIAREKK